MVNRKCEFFFLHILVQGVLVVLEFMLSYTLCVILLKCNMTAYVFLSIYWHVQLHSSYQGKYS